MSKPRKKLLEILVYVVVSLVLGIFLFVVISKLISTTHEVIHSEYQMSILESRATRD